MSLCICINKHKCLIEVHNTCGSIRVSSNTCIRALTTNISKHFNHIQQSMISKYVRLYQGTLEHIIHIKAYNLINQSIKRSQEAKCLEACISHNIKSFRAYESHENQKCHTKKNSKSNIQTFISHKISPTHILPIYPPLASSTKTKNVRLSQ